MDVERGTTTNHVEVLAGHPFSSTSRVWRKHRTQLMLTCLIPDTAEVGNLPINRQEVAWPSDVDRYGDPPDPRGMGDVAIGGWRNISDPVAWNKICLSCFDMHVSDRGMSSVRPHTWLHFWIVWRGVTVCLYIYIYILYAYTKFRECSTRTLSKGLRMDTLCINKVLT